MTLTQTAPAVGFNIGPGVQVRVSTDLIGPLPVDTHWRVQVFLPGATETFVATEFVQLGPTQHQLNYLFGDAARAVQIPNFASGTTVKNGDSVRLVVQLERTDGTVLDQTSQLQVWDDTQQYKLLPTVGAEGTFTEADRSTLELSQEQTQVSIPILGGLGDLTSALADWATLSHGALFVRGPVILLQDRGSLPITVVTNRGLPFGGFFSWFTVPAQLGVQDGVRPHYTRALLEIALVYADAGLNLYDADVMTFREDGKFVEWPPLKPPERIDYWVLPGVVVAWQFMYTR